VVGFIAAQRAQFGIPHATSCRALGVSPAWLYKWLHGDSSLRRARRQALTTLVVVLFGRHRGHYGSPRITDDLRAMGWRVSVNTVAAIMAEQQLVARPRRRRRSLTMPDRSARKAPDLLHRNFNPPPRANVAWVGDLTEIPCGEGPFYLAVVLDLHSRRAVGFALGAHHDAALATAALQWRSRCAAATSLG
jgi:putative transposase